MSPTFQISRPPGRAARVAPGGLAYALLALASLAAPAARRRRWKSR
jgi:hypothetical protein